MMSQAMPMPRGQACGQPGQHPAMSEPSQMFPHQPPNIHQMNPNLPTQKTSMTSMDSQYMQQQSQIFVFSTQLANKAAEAVDSGEFPTIIDFHCAHSGTKKMLDKHPLKVQQFNRQNPAVWLNNLAQMKQGGRGIKGNINASGISPPMLTPFGMGPRGIGPSCTGPCNAHTSCFPPGPGPGGGVNGGGGGGSVPGGGMGGGQGWPGNPNMCSTPPWQQQQQFAQNVEMNSSQKFAAGPMGSGPRACGPTNPMSCNSFNANNFQLNSPMFSNQGGCNAGMC